MSDQPTQPTPAQPALAEEGIADDYATEPYWDGEPDQLPPRRRRRLFTPLTGALLGVLLAGCGFAAGVLVEKGQMGATTATSPSAARGASARTGGGAGGPAAAFGGQSAGATVGQVSTVNGRTLYVQDVQGNTVKVVLPTGANVVRTTTSRVGAIHPGDTVIVQGTKSAGGTVTATQINATSSSAASGLAGLFGGGGGFRGGAGGGGAAPQGPGG